MQESSLEIENRKKSAWIQKAKALMFDVISCVDAQSIREEIETLIEDGGGYDPRTETSESELKWDRNKFVVGFTISATEVIERMRPTLDALRDYDKGE